MKRKALENQFELQELALKRELAEKKAIAEECQRLENLQNPFSVLEDLSGGTSFKEISTSLPRLKPLDKVKEFVSKVTPADVGLDQSSASAPLVSSPAAQASIGQSRNVHESQNAILLPNYTNDSRIRPSTRIPDIKVWVFNGDETEYNEWERSFRALVETRVHCINENMSLWKQHLGPAPLKVVKSYFLSETEESYQKAIAGLKSRYGSSIVVGQSFLKKLKSFGFRSERKINLDLETLRIFWSKELKIKRWSQNWTPLIMLPIMYIL